jgi:lipoprotein signal peptidase
MICLTDRNKGKEFRVFMMIDTIKRIAGMAIAGVIIGAIVGAPLEFTHLIVWGILGIIMGGIGIVLDRLFPKSEIVEAQSKWMDHPIIIVIIGVTTIPDPFVKTTNLKK